MNKEYDYLNPHGLKDDDGISPRFDPLPPEFDHTIGNMYGPAGK